MPLNKETKPNRICNQKNLKMLTMLWKYINDIISNSLHMFTISVNTFLESPASDEKC